MLGQLAVAIAGLLAHSSHAAASSLLFEPNHGQAASNVAFLARGDASTAAIGADGTLTMSFAGEAVARRQIAIVPLDAQTPRIEPLDRQQGVLNRLLGSDPMRWQRALPLYRRVRAAQLYPGIDAEYYGTGSHPEYDFLVAPGSNPSAVRFRIDGARVARGDDGSLLFVTPDGTVEQRRPVAYQIVGGVRRPVTADYLMHASVISFGIGDYDRSMPLVIDPVLITSTLVTQGHAIVWSYPVFTADALYLAGHISEFNTDHVYVAKYSLDGRTLIFKTIYGGTNHDYLGRIATDDTGAIYVTGSTYSSDLPQVGTQLQSGLIPPVDAFLAKFSGSDGSILLSTYFGGPGADGAGPIAVGDSIYILARFASTPTFFAGLPSRCCEQASYIVRLTRAGSALAVKPLDGLSAEALALGPDGGVYVGGLATANGLATPGAFMTSTAASICNTGSSSQQCGDAYVAHFSPDLTSTIWATYLHETAFQPTNARDGVGSLAVYPNGDVAVFGETLSKSFPVTPNALQTTCVACDPGTTYPPSGVPFVTRINRSGSGLVFSTFFSGNSGYLEDGSPHTDARASELTLDALGNIVLTGITWTASFPAAGPQLPQDAALTRDRFDGFVSALTPSGALLYSSRLGGSGLDGPYGVAVSRYDTIAVTGYTNSSDYPLQNPLETTGAQFLTILALPQVYTVLDAPPNGRIRGRGFTIGGWAIDPRATGSCGVDAVHVYAYPAAGGSPIFVGAAVSGLNRPDVGAALGSATFAASGFSTTGSLPPGDYTLAAFAHSTVTGTFAAAVTTPVTVIPATTELHVDVPSGPSLFQTFTVGGWAIDAGAPTGTGVDAIHVWARPLAGGASIFLGSTTTFVSRPDVAAARGARFQPSGFMVKTESIPPGDYDVITYAHSTVSLQFDAVDTRRLTVLAATGGVIQVTNIADGARVTGLVTLKGYAFDPRAATGLGVDAVHLYLYPDWGSGAPAQFVGLAAYDTASDGSLAARFGTQFDRAGFSAFFPLPEGPGTHLLVMYAHSSVDGSFTPVSRLVTVPAAQFVASIDVPQPNAMFTGGFHIGGWGIDRADVDLPGDGTGIEYVQVYAYPAAGGSPIYVCGPSVSNGNLFQGGIRQRPDVAAVFGARFLNSGWECPINSSESGATSLAPGTYDLAVFLFSNRTRQYSAPAFARFTVQ